MRELRDENILRLKDGRKLGYAEYGNPDGFPIFLLHGNPGSRLIWGLLPTALLPPDLHVIAPDRPGYGLSEYSAHRSVADFPEDIVELADSLGVGEFSLAGFSGGGPAALACAWKIPDRLYSVGVISSVGPLEKPLALIGMRRMFRALYRASYFLPWIVRAQMGFVASLARRNPEKLQN
ncbi:MAG: alpha/beta hydrolase, partial [Pirellulales bacterium]|nr:alpha/beta hydrolase [Pirellulales bacterium]